MKKLVRHERLKFEGGKHLSVEHHTVKLEHPLHWHSYFEIEIILSGTGKYIINDLEYDLSEKNVFFLNPTDFHCLKLTEETKLINLSFDEETVDESDVSTLLFSKTQKAYYFDDDERERIIMACKLLSYECESNGKCKSELLKYILACVFKKNESETDSLSIKSEHLSGIKRAIVYLELHFREDLLLSEIAAEAGYHPTYFSELFKKVTGETFTEALARRRVGYARMLLANGISATDACYLSGFRSFSNFSSAFKRQCGISPGQYRIKYREG